MSLLTQNSELRKARVWNWTLPAWYVHLSSGERFMTCPNAGACAQLCYARQGTYRFRNVRAAHLRNLEQLLADPAAWIEEMHAELQHKRFAPTGEPRNIPGLRVVEDEWLLGWVMNGGAAVRIHDSGDFFAPWYLEAWLEIARRNPTVLFYAYTKEVRMFREHPTPFPPNFRHLFSTGGLQDNDINPELDRHAEVFATPEKLDAAGYADQEASDLLAVLLPTTRIGIVANNIVHIRKRMAGRSFTEMTRASLRMTEGSRSDQN